MSEVVIQFPLTPGEEAQLFGDYLTAFMESSSSEAGQGGEDADAPFLMVHSDPLQDVELKVVTFQRDSAAKAFCSGWALARSNKRVNGRR